MVSSLIAQLLPLLPVLPLGLLAGLLSGLLGIGGGVVFSPLLLALGLEPHQALATSTLAIVPTTLGGSLTHLGNGTLPPRQALVMALAAAVAATAFSHLGLGLHGGWLLALQALMYAVLFCSIRPRSTLESSSQARATLPALAGVGGVAGLASGLVGVGGGLVMVPMLVQGLAMPVHQAVRLSTVAVLASALTASTTFVRDGRADLGIGLLLGATAALGAQWSAARLQRVPEARLVVLLRGLTMLVACDSARRAVLALL